jgi:hypothetical protein
MKFRAVSRKEPENVRDMLDCNLKQGDLEDTKVPKTHIIFIVEC